MAYPMKRHEVVQPQDQSIKLIPLTRGQNAIVDAADYDFLMQWNWYAFLARGRRFYAARFQNIDGKRHMIFMHRVITGGDGEETDHWNGNGLDNRRHNLRPCSKWQNRSNAGKQCDNTSGYKGVSWNKSNEKWQAQTSLRGQRVHLGFFPAPEDAYAAYCKFTNVNKGEFANLG